MSTEILPPQQFKDRKGGLVIFGILTIVGGCVCMLFALIGLAAPTLAAHGPNPPAVQPSRLPALIYVFNAVAFIWLGIGSIQAKRWARALLAVLSWTFFIFGILGIVFMAMMLPRLKGIIASAAPPNQPAPSNSMQSVVIIGTSVFFGLFFVLGPLLWALFYSGRNVKATCEALDPVPRWTDRCPLPVLAISLWLFFGAIAMLAMSASYPAAPLFGLLISGVAARLYYVSLAIIWIYAAWSIYRLEVVGWWIALVATIVSGVSSGITYSHHSLSEMYTLLGYPPQQVAAIEKLGPLTTVTTWSWVIWIAPTVIYLIYIRKFFRRTVIVTEQQ